MLLSEVYREILLEQEGNSNIFYHGTKHQIDLNSLDLSRDSLERKEDGSIQETASVQRGKGLYVTKDLWKSSSKNNDAGDYFKEPVYVGVPAYSEGPGGHQSAEKYATLGDTDGGKIYRIVVRNDFRFEKYGFEGVDGRNVVEENWRKLLSMGVDGLITSDEAVILNKDKIESFDLAYKAEGYLRAISRVDFSKSSSWVDVTRKPVSKIHFEHPIYTTRENEGRVVSELLGGTFAIEKDPRSSQRMYFNIAPEHYECINGVQCGDLNRAELHQKYSIDNPKLKGLYTCDNGVNWIKQR